MHTVENTTEMGVQNDLKGGKFGKKWLLDIKVPVFSYLFHHKNVPIFTVTTVKKFKMFKFWSEVDWKMTPMTPGRADKFIFSKKCAKQYFRKSQRKW